jgi:hypothetical protein
MTKLIQICFSPVSKYTAWEIEQTDGGEMYGLDEEGLIWKRECRGGYWIWARVDDGIDDMGADDQATE